MTLIDCLQEIRNTQVDSRVSKTLKKAYGSKVPVIIEQTVSFFKSGGFVEGYRFLSLDEIEYAEDDLHVNFKRNGLIPLIDCGDNDFAVYNYIEGKWMMFNIVEQVCFKTKNELDDLLAY